MWHALAIEALVLFFAAFVVFLIVAPQRLREIATMGLWLASAAAVLWSIGVSALRLLS